MGELIGTQDLLGAVAVAEGRKGELAVLNGEGDFKTIWDSEKPEEVEAAKKTFDDLKKKGYAAYRVKKNGEKGEVIKEFDPGAEKIILAPLMAGG
jgi:hypothetical protein